MNERKYAIFYNKTYEVLLNLKEHEITVNNVTYSPLIFRDIGSEVGLVRQTVSLYIQQLEDAGYIKVLQKGKIQITEEGNKAIKQLK